MSGGDRVSRTEPYESDRSQRLTRLTYWILVITACSPLLSTFVLVSLGWTIISERGGEALPAYVQGASVPALATLVTGVAVGVTAGTLAPRAGTSNRYARELAHNLGLALAWPVAIVGAWLLCLFVLSILQNPRLPPTDEVSLAVVVFTIVSVWLQGPTAIIAGVFGRWCTRRRKRTPLAVLAVWTFHLGWITLWWSAALAWVG